MQDRPWSKKQMEVLAQCLRHNLEPPHDCPDYEEVMIWYDELAAEVHEIIPGLPWPPSCRTPSRTSPSG